MAAETTDTVREQRAVKGLATLALLKANFDAGEDHIGMFQPFILETLRRSKKEDFGVEELKEDIRTECGLQIPSPTLKTLLTRSSRQGIVNREGGHYFVNLDKLPSSTDRLTSVQHHNTELGARLVEFAAKYDVTLESPEQALSLLLDFLAEYDVELLLDYSPPLKKSQYDDSHSTSTKLVARFIEDVCFSDKTLMRYLRQLLEGYVLQNALLLKDIGSPRKEFADLSVYLDSMYLFEALGLAGASAETAARETIDLLIATGAQPKVLHDTIDEMKRILSLYEERLQTTAGRRSLRRSALTTYFLTNRYSPSDVKQVKSLLETHIQSLDIAVEAKPKHIRKYTLDEASLAQHLVEGSQDHPTDPRVVHDVECIAAVMTRRKGNVPEKLDDANAIFATNSPSVVRCVNEWFREMGVGGFPPIIHTTNLSSQAWLKRPDLHVDLKVHELSSMCASVLRPSQQLWDSFLIQLEKLESSGWITSDESIAIVASDFIDHHLSEIEIDGHDDPDADTLTEVVERVKAKYREEADQQVAEATERELSARESKRQTELQVRNIANSIASVVSWLVFVSLSVAILFGLLVVPWLFVERLDLWGQILSYAAVLLAALAGAIDLVWGRHLTQWRKVIHRYLRDRLRRWLLGGDDETK